MSKILILKFGALGDVVMATSLVRQIQRFHKHDSIFLITSPAYIGVFENWQELNIVTFRRKGFWETVKMIRWIRNSGFRRVYDLQSNDRTSIVCALSGIKEKVGNHPRYPYTHHPSDPWIGQGHIYDRMLALLKSAGIMPESTPPILFSNEYQKSRINEWLHNHKLKPGCFAIIHAGASSSHPEKCWPYFLDLAKLLHESGIQVIWIGTAIEENENRRRAETVGIDASNVFSITELAELGKRARFAVTNDSGPMHILSGSGIPVFAFFGPTNWLRSHAVGQKENIIIPPGHMENVFHPGRLDKITPKDVIEKLLGAAML